MLPVFFFLLVFGALARGFMKGTKRQRESWNSYELMIGEDFLIRRIQDFKELEIQQHEIMAIKESATGLHVETNQKDRVIGIASANGLGWKNPQT
jgi:hypothetical protein